MFRIEDAKGRTIRSAASNQIVTLINPKRKIKIIPSGHIDSVTAGHSTTAQQASDDALEAVALAQKYANNPANVDFTLDDGSSAYSALHYSTLAGASQTAALASANNASTSQTNSSASETAAGQSANAATNASADARKIADYSLSQPYTLSDNVTTGYSASYYANQASTNATSVSADKQQFDTDFQTFNTNYGAFTTNYATFGTNYTTFATNYATFATDYPSFESDYTDFGTNLTTQTTALSEAASSLYSIAGVHTNFDQRYQGDFSSNPTTRTGGGALQIGDLYYYTGTSEEMRVWDGSQWRSQVSTLAPKTRHTYIFTVNNNSGHSFSGSDLNSATLEMDNDDLVEVHINGVRIRDDEFTVNTTTNTLTINNDVSLSPGEDVLITVHEHFTVVSAFPAQGGTFTGNVNFGSDVDFNDDVTFSADVTADDMTVSGELDVSVIKAGQRVEIDAPYNSVYNINVNMIELGVNSAGIVGQLGLKRSYPNYPNTFTHDRLFIESRNPATQSSVAGLQFENTVIYPRYDGDIDDGTNVSLGDSGHKFHELHVDTLNTTDITADEVNLGLQATIDAESNGQINIDSNGQGIKLDGHAMKASEIQIADDGIGSVTPPRNGGWFMFASDMDGDHPVGGEASIFWYDIGGTKRLTRAIDNNYVGGNLRIIAPSATTVPTDASDYADGKVHLHVGNDGDIYIVNRSGASRTFHFLFM